MTKACFAKPPRSPKHASALERLEPGEAQAVLARLLAAHPDLQAEAEQTARSLLGEVTFENVADDVEQGLRSLGPLGELVAQRRGLHHGPRSAVRRRRQAGELSHGAHALVREPMPSYCTATCVSRRRCPMFTSVQQHQAAASQVSIEFVGRESTHDAMGVLAFTCTGPRMPSTLALTMSISFDLALRDPRLIRERVRRRGGSSPASRWPTFWLEGTVYDYVIGCDPFPPVGTSRRKLVVLAEGHQVFVPARAATLAAGVRRAWDSGLDAVAGIDGAVFSGLLDEDEHAFLVNMLVLVHARPAANARPRPSARRRAGSLVLSGMWPTGARRRDAGRGMEQVRVARSPLD